MNSIVEYVNGKPQIKRAVTFCSLLNNKLPSELASFKNILNEMDSQILSEHPDVTNGALSNCHGDWYEWLIAVSAWNYSIKNNKSYVILLLPNVNRFDVALLYNSQLSDYIVDLREKVKFSTDVQLITSNPDFVIIDKSNLVLNGLSNKEISSFSPLIINDLENFFKKFAGKCDFENIIGYLSVKTSLRPDRRLQISHEGSLMKAIYVHLQTRKWVINPKGLKYYAASTSIGIADRRGLKTVATHSITNVQSIPVAAVDEVYQIDSVKDAIKAFDEIIL